MYFPETRARRGFRVFVIPNSYYTSGAFAGSHPVRIAVRTVVRTYFLGPMALNIEYLTACSLAARM